MTDILMTARQQSVKRSSWNSLWGNATDQEKDVLRRRLRDFKIPFEDATPQEKMDAINCQASDFEKLYCNQIASRGSSSMDSPPMRTPQTTVRTRKLTEDVLKTLNAKPSKKIRSRKKIVFPDGNIYEGDTVHEVLDGEGEMAFKNGAIYTGGFRDSKEHGYGKLVKGSNMYEGAWKAGKKHGKGVQIYKSGAIYDGEFKDGKKDGKGKYISKNRNVYDGEWVSGKRHGHGKYTWADGRVYVGEFKDDKQYGKGEYTWKNGAYQGEYKDGKFHGIGKYTWTDGRIYEGEWKAGKKYGKGKYIFANGDVYEGEFEYDKFHGKGILISKSGNVCDGEWKRGKRCRKGKKTIKNGAVYDGELEDGHGHGKRNCKGKGFYDGQWQDDKTYHLRVKDDGFVRPISKKRKLYDNSIPSKRNADSRPIEIYCREC